MEQQRIGSPGGSFTNTPGGSSAGSSLTGSNLSTGSSVTSIAKEQGHRALDRLRQNAIAKVEDQKSMACKQVDQLATGLRRTGETLQREGAEPFGSLASSAAETVERFGSYLDRTDVEGLLRDVGSAARRNPTMVFGAALAAGVLLGRFLRSSRPSEHEVIFTPDASLLDSSTGIGGSSLGSYGTGSTMGAGSTMGTGSSMGSSLGSDGNIGSGSTLGSGTTRGNFGGDPPTGGWA